MIVLSIHAHPDDNELGCGAALLRHIHNGDEVHLAVATDGGRTAKGQIRAGEQRAACAVLGIDHLHLLGVNGGDFRQSGETTRLFIDLVREVQPEIVYTHFTGDTHQEHREVGLTAISAARQSSVKTVLLTESVTSVDFAPNWYAAVQEELFVRKVAALRQHHSQLGRWDRNGLSLVEATAAMGRFRGSQIGAGYAEAFVLYRRIER